MTLLELARKLRTYIEKAAMSLDDEDSLEAVQLFPTWDAEHGTYNAGEKVRYEDILYKCLQTHIAQENWYPSAAASLWAKVLIPDENVIPEWEQPDSTNPYMAGDKVSYNDKIWESTVDNNVWAPGVYGWVEVN